MPTSNGERIKPFYLVSTFIHAQYMTCLVRRRYLPQEIIELIIDFSLTRIIATDERYTMLLKRPRPYPVVSIHHPGSFYFVHLYKHMCLLIHVREERVVYYYDNNFEYEKNIAFVMP